MLLGIKSKKTVLLRHLTMGLIAAVLYIIFMQVNSSLALETSVWRSLGATAFTLLWFTVFIGPVARLWHPLRRFVPWRRESGIWLVGVALIHELLIVSLWFGWSVWQFFGYRYSEAADAYIRAEPGMGLANTMAEVALLLAIVLALTSFDKAVSYLGIGSWKWLHMFAYVIFFLISFHVLYYSFIHYSLTSDQILSLSVTDPNVNPLRFYYLFAVLSVITAQAAAFIKTVYSQRHPGK